MSFNSSRSADSGSKSKRSFNSTTSNRSSNPSSNSDSSKKQKKTTQKTLGMAWGSNSRSASRSSFRNSPFSDFGSYMAVKNQKLQEQFEAEATSSSNSGSNSGKPIFQGVSIFVDGFTIPSSQELKGYMLKHGGRFENYFSRHRVTHIICSNLPDSKIKNLRSFSAGLPVVKPAWLLDSVAANKLLSWVPYELEQVASETHNQPKLSSFFALKSSALSNDPTTCVTGQVNSEIEDPSLIGGTIKESDLSGRCGYTEHLRPCSRESRDWDDSVHGNSTSVKIGEATCNDGECSEGNVAEPSNGLPIDKGSVDDRDPGSPSGPSASVISDNANKSTSSAIAGPSKRHHSTLVDPNFVENYFKKSRLHFIGTWRSRYRKRFPSSIYTSSNVNASGQRTNVIHVDMDCFFVSVVIRNHPELQDNPVAVCHSDNPRGTAEISSANYPARSYGVRAGIFVRDAKALCPHLTIFPYDFGAYEEVADQFYNILHKHCKKVQAVSCDEAFLEVRDFEVEDPQFLASVIRKEIVETTGCTASAGISGNLLMARLATKAAKPDGQCYIPPEKVDDYLNELPIKSLPGIGHVLEEKLKRKQIQTCGQLRMISKESLQKEFGVKTGDMLWNHSRGVDNRLVGVIQESKSVGAEVNWGVRFNDMKDCQHFLTNLCKEVSLRLQGCAVEGRSFTLKIKKRRSDAEEPVKYMGCGDCENLSHSMTVPMATDDVDIIRRITTQLFGSFHIDVKDIRGMGLQVSKLESVDTAKQDSQGMKGTLFGLGSALPQQVPKSCLKLVLQPKRVLVEVYYKVKTFLSGLQCGLSSASGICWGKLRRKVTYFRWEGLMTTTDRHTLISSRRKPTNGSQWMRLSLWGIGSIRCASVGQNYGGDMHVSTCEGLFFFPTVCTLQDIKFFAGRCIMVVLISITKIVIPDRVLNKEFFFMFLSLKVSNYHPFFYFVLKLPKSPILSLKYPNPTH
ncbi:DNA repair protein REV1 isoform X8 [Rhododendron vialii]|uniref:DNA repair protein REV1 isoform X8 n=1 Tax=Rhododendron vialii TaxID=182163 RepID=UPI00265D7792|nr:DNA repair protein REV1 isoform X8 [Rhododendron vialii]